MSLSFDKWDIPENSQVLHSEMQELATWREESKQNRIGESYSIFQEQ